MHLEVLKSKLGCLANEPGTGKNPCWRGAAVNNRGMLSPLVANLENGVSYLAVAVVLAGALTMAPVVAAQDMALGFPMFRV